MSLIKRHLSSLFGRCPKFLLQVFDREKTGFMSSSDFRSIMTSLGESMSQGEADRMVKDADRKGEGLVNIDGSYIFISGV